MANKIAVTCWKTGEKLDFNAQTEKTVYIYGLTDGKGQIHYVGKTQDPLKRCQDHYRSGKYYDNRKVKTYCARWIKNCISNRETIVMVILEQVSADNWGERESYWIDFFKKSGLALKNMTSGGDGFPDLIEEVEMARRAKVSATKTGKKMSEQACQNMREARRIYMQDEAVRIEIARKVAKLTDEQALQVWKLAKEGLLTHREIGRIFNICQSSVSNIKNNKIYKHIKREDVPDQNIKQTSKEHLIKLALEMHMQGCEYSEIIAVTGWTKDLIHNHISKLDGYVPHQHAKVKEEQVLKLIVEEGKARHAIEKELNLSRGCVYRIVLRLKEQGRICKDIIVGTQKIQYLKNEKPEQN